MDQTKSLLILGGNQETIRLVTAAQKMGLVVHVTDDNPSSPAKKVADFCHNVDGLDVQGIVELALKIKADGVLVGVADILVSSYSKVCEILGLPCYSSLELSRSLSEKDLFKKQLSKVGLKGIPEYSFEGPKNYPLMLKPADNGGGVGMFRCDSELQFHNNYGKALAASRKKVVLIERYIEADDLGIYFVFEDGKAFLSCVYDRFTTKEQHGFSNVCVGGTYPSRFAQDYYQNVHDKLLLMFENLGIKYGVLMLSAFKCSDEFYFYDTGFRLQGEAPDILIKDLNSYDQCEKLIEFALQGKYNPPSLSSCSDPFFGGIKAATVWFLLKQGVIDSISGIDLIKARESCIHISQRLFEGDVILEHMVGNEKQVFARVYLKADSDDALRSEIQIVQETIVVLDKNQNNLVLRGMFQ